MDDPWKMMNDYYHNAFDPTPDEEFIFVEAMNYLIRESDETVAMINLADYYKKKEHYDLALKYLEMAEDHGEETAFVMLGDIWREGLTGKADLVKAYDYYSRSESIFAKIRLADMYLDKRFPDADPDVYIRMIEKLYSDLDMCLLPNQKGYICKRMGEICVLQYRDEEAISLHLDAMEYLEKGMSLFPAFFEEDIKEMKDLVEEFFIIVDINYDLLDLYDLFEVLRAPARVSFMYGDTEYMVESVRETDDEEEIMAVSFNGKLYRSVTDFFRKARIGGKSLPKLYYELTDFKMV